MKIVDANRQALRSLKTSRETIVTRSAGDFLDEEVLSGLLTNSELIDGWTPSRVVPSSFSDAHETEVRVICLRPASGERLFAVKLLGEALRSRTFQKLREDLLLTHERAEREEQLRRELQDINAKLTVFAHRISHDLRSPLRNIKLLLEYYIEELPEGSEAPELLLHARDVSVSVDNVVTSLLEYSKSTSKTIRKTRVTLAGVIRDSAQQVFGADKWIVSCLEDLHDVKADRALLEIVFQNLFANSEKFRSPDRPLSIRIACVPLGSGIRIGIEDNGIGFSPDASEKIFQMFARAHSHIDGSGIGLATCADLIRGHGWSISAEGRPGQGAAFYIDIPAPDVCDHPAGSCNDPDCCGDASLVC